MKFVTTEPYWKPVPCPRCKKPTDILFVYDNGTKLCPECALKVDRKYREWYFKKRKG